MITTVQAITPRRAQLLARLAAERAHLLAQFEGLDEAILSEEPVGEGWTVASLLAHLGYWEAFAANRLAKLAEGRLSEIEPLGGEDSLDARNAAMHTQFDGLRFGAALALCQKERRSFILALGQIPDDVLFRRVELRPGWYATPGTWASWPHKHDAEHGLDLARWRKRFLPPDPSIRVIQRSLLRPILGLSRREFVALAALIPPTDREERPLEGTWTLKNIIGHLADYELLGITALKAIFAGRDPHYETTIDDFDTFNNARDTVWATTPWDEVWANFLATRQALVMVAEKLPEQSLAQPFAAPWKATTTACGYLLDMAQHEQEHADGLRRALALPPLPRRLGRAR